MKTAGGGGRVTTLCGGTYEERLKVIGGRLGRTREVEGLPILSGSVSVACGTGYASPPQPAEAGVILRLRVTPSGGTVLLLR